MKTLIDLGPGRSIEICPDWPHELVTIKSDDVSLTVEIRSDGILNLILNDFLYLFDADDGEVLLNRYVGHSTEAHITKAQIEE